MPKPVQNETKEEKPKRRMAVKKPAPPPSPLAKVRKNWKTNDLALDFELSFDNEGDPQVSVFEADADEPVDLTADLVQLDEVISILKAVREAAARMMGGEVKPEDLDSGDGEEENDEGEEDEEEEDADEP